VSVNVRHTDLINVLDENGNPTGDVKNKAEIHEQGLWHKAAHIWIYNSKGEVLLQLRAIDKDSYPGLWDISVAGHTDTGEIPLDSAVRELNEEIGLSVDSSQLEFDSVVRISQPIEGTNWQDNELGYVYFYRFDGAVNQLSTPDGEVEKLKFVPLDQFKSEINNPDMYKKFVPYLPHRQYYRMVIKKIRHKINHGKYI